MKLDNIKLYKEKFKLWLKEQEDFKEVYKYENLINYRANWDIDSNDFHSMYDNSFKSRISNSLWGGSVNSAKSVMLLFIQTNPEYVRSMFKDLYNEDKDLMLRINRFALHCEEMMDQLPNNKLKPVDHKHSLKLMSVYLSFHDPSLYTLVSYNAFKRMLELLEVREVPQEFEMERLFKLSRVLYKILSSDEDLIEAHQNLIPEQYRTESNLLLVHDFYLNYKHFKSY